MAEDTPVHRVVGQRGNDLPRNHSGERAPTGVAEACGRRETLKRNDGRAMQ